MSHEHRLTVKCADPLAEITVYDGAFKRVGRGVGGYWGKHEDGLYEVRVRLGGAIQEQLVSLDRNLTIAFKAVAFASAIPLAGTTSSDDSHAAAVNKALAQPEARGAGSGLLLVVRDRPGREAATPPTATAPAAGLTLVWPDGSQTFDVGAGAPPDPAGQVPIAAVYLEVDPGVYRLRLDLPHGGARERTLVASPGWRTECFMVRRSFREHLLPDLDHGSVSIGRLGNPFAPDDKRIRLAEAAREALVTRRQVADAAAKALMREKFEDPMLGLLVAYLLLRDKPKASALYWVIFNLIRLLGKDNPDVRALALATPHEDPEPGITEMPMLRASWDRIVEQSLSRPDLVPVDSPAGQLSARVLPGAPWLVWEPADAPSRRVDSKMTALRSYISNSGGKPPPPGVQFDFAQPAAALDDGDRQELARSLAVPASVLDDMLSKLDD